MEQIPIRLRLETLKPDPIQYKPYDVSYTPADDVLVEVNVDVDHVVEDRDGSIVITPKGAANIAKQIAASIYGMHWEFEQWKQAQGR